MYFYYSRIFGFLKGYRYIYTFARVFLLFSQDFSKSKALPVVKVIGDPKIGQTNTNENANENFLES